MVTFENIEFVRIATDYGYEAYNGQITLYPPNQLGPLIFSVSWGTAMSGIGPLHDTYEIALYNKEYSENKLNKIKTEGYDNMLQLTNFNTIVPYVSKKDINEFMTIVQNATTLDEILMHFR